MLGAKPVAAASITSDDKPYGVRIESGGQALRGDEPVADGGGDTGPAPFGLLLAGLGVCTAITFRMYVERRRWPLTRAEVKLSYMRRTGRTGGSIGDHAARPARRRPPRAKLAEIAAKTPATKAVRAGTEIRTTVEGSDHKGVVSVRQPVSRPRGGSPMSLNRSRSEQPAFAVASSAVLIGEAHIGAGALLAHGVVLRSRSPVPGRRGRLGLVMRSVP